MKEFQDKVALVTGAGSGIGRSMALAFAKEGMKLTVVDINSKSLESVAGEIRKTGAEVMSKVVDVSDREQMSRLADDVYQEFGRVNILCNNAGIGGGYMFSEIHLEDWNWTLGVDLYGVIYGVHFFLKRMLESNEECHIVNTASIAGLLPSGSSTYGVAKAGVVAISECLYEQTQRSKVGVSVLCPGYVKTNINHNTEALAVRKEDLYKAPEERRKIFQPFIDNLQRQLDNGTDPDIVAKMVINSIREKRFYILPHPDFLQFVEMRMKSINNDALSLKEAMASMGVRIEKKEKKTYINKSPYFSISYPGEWTEQVSTIISQFDFGAVSPVGLPNLEIRINAAPPPDQFKNSINFLSQFMSMQLGIKNAVILQKESSLSDGTPVLEGEVESVYDGINKFITLVLNAVQGDKIISAHLTCVKNRYDDVMKKELREIAYSLSIKK